MPCKSRQKPCHSVQFSAKVASGHQGHGNGKSPIYKTCSIWMYLNVSECIWMYLNVSDREFPLPMLDSRRVSWHEASDIARSSLEPDSGELTMPRAVLEPWHGGIPLNLCCSLALSLSLIYWLNLIYIWWIFCSTFKRCQDVCRAILTWGGISSFWRSIAESYQMLLQNWQKCVIRTEGADTCGHQKCPAYFGNVDLGGCFFWSAGVPPTFTIRTSGPRSSAGSCRKKNRQHSLYQVPHRPFRYSMVPCSAWKLLLVHWSRTARLAPRAADVKSGENTERSCRCCP